jgi:predicted RNA-binding protein with PIN domain
MERDVDAAAQILVERLTLLHDPEHLEVTIVFDGRGGVMQKTYDPIRLPCVLYSPSGVSADALIEQMLSRAPRPDDFTVATRDNAIALSAHAARAHVITPADLAEWVKREHTAATRNIGRIHKGGGDFGNRLF